MYVVLRGTLIFKSFLCALIRLTINQQIGLDPIKPFVVWVIGVKEFSQFNIIGIKIATDIVTVFWVIFKYYRKFSLNIYYF